MNTANLIWIKVRELIPNNRNPRQNPTIKTQEIQKILSTKGFEEAIVAYKSGSFYTIISGHRRWWASKELGLEEVPVYVVPEPKNTLEELERLGSIQGNQNDWNEYEWLIHTSNLFKSNSNMSFEELANKLNTSVQTVQKRIFAVDFFPKKDLEVKIVNQSFSVHMLDVIRLWCLRVKKYYPELYLNLTEKYIKESMLQKLENKCLNSEILKGDYLQIAGEDRILEFLTSPTYKIKDFVRLIYSSKNKTIEYDLSTNLKSLKKASSNIKNLKYHKKNEALLIFEELNLLESELENLNSRILSKKDN